MNHFSNSLKRIGALFAVMMLLVLPANASYSKAERVLMLEQLSKDSTTVFFRKPNTWSTVYCHCWSKDAKGNGSNITSYGSTGGVQITDVLSGTDIYYLTHSSLATALNITSLSSIPTSLLFSDKGDESKKTGDYMWVDGGYYEYATSSGSDMNPTETFNRYTHMITYTGTSTNNDTIYCYVEDTSGKSGQNCSDYCGYWPGRAMTKVGENKWTYTLITTKPARNLRIFFHDHTKYTDIESKPDKQDNTSELILWMDCMSLLTKDTTLWSYTSSKHLSTYIDSAIVYHDYTYRYKVHYDNALNITQPYCYVYNVEEDVACKSWPGTAMTKVDDVWTCVLDSVKTVPNDLTVIFGDGGDYDTAKNDYGDPNKHVQSANLKFTDYLDSTVVHMPAVMTSVGYATFSPGYKVDVTVNQDEKKTFTPYRATVADRTLSTVEPQTNSKDSIVIGEGLLLKATYSTSGLTVNDTILVNAPLAKTDTVTTTLADKDGIVYTATNNNILIGALRDIATIATHEENSNYYNYILNYTTKKGTGFYRAAGYGIDKGKAYLQVEGESNAMAKIESFIFGETTGIEAVTAAADAEATPAVYYNLAGQRVSESYKGVVIVGGKKVIRK